MLRNYTLSVGSEMMACISCIPDPFCWLVIYIITVDSSVWHVCGNKQCQQLFGWFLQIQVHSYTL